MCKTTFKFHSVWHRREAEDTCTGRKEVSCIIIGMEADEVAIENTIQNFTADWENSAY